MNLKLILFAKVCIYDIRYFYLPGTWYFYFYKNASYNLAGILFVVALAKTTIKSLVLSHLTIEQVVNNHDKQ